MANRLKVGLLKEEMRALEHGETVTTLVVDGEARWFCSEIINGQLQEKLIKSGIFDTKNRHHVVVDDELAQTSGVQPINEHTASRLEAIINSYLIELCSDCSSEPHTERLSEEALAILREVTALVKVFDCVKQNVEVPKKWQRVITMEL